MLTIPAQADILARASDLRRDSQLQRDSSAVKAFNAIIASVVCDYDVLSWDGPYLTVASESHPGATHQVSGFGCSCEARKPCWHQRLRDLLLDMLQTEAESADMDAEMEDEPPSYRPLGMRLAAARSAYAYQ
jgi:hypothetical protein